MILDHMPIWVVLLATVGLVVLALETGVRLGRRRLLRAGGKSEVSGAVAFSAVLFLIADLDRPQEGLINVSQQAMDELQAKLNAR